MTKHRAVVAGYDSGYENPDGSTGRPKGVQTAADMRIATTYDVLAEGVFAPHGTPVITGSPTDLATISPFMAAIESPAGGFYIVQIDADESLTINLANTGLVKIFVQQRDWQVDNVSEDSEVVLGAVYGAASIPDGALQLFEATITSQTSTSGLSFNPVFKWTGAASGVIRVPTEADLDDVAVKNVGIRALALDGSGEWFFGADSEWHETTIANPKLEAALDNFKSNGEFGDNVVKSGNIDFTTFGATANVIPAAGYSLDSNQPLRVRQSGNIIIMNGRIVPTSGSITSGDKLVANLPAGVPKPLAQIMARSLGNGSVNARIWIEPSGGIYCNPDANASYIVFMLVYSV